MKPTGSSRIHELNEAARIRRLQGSNAHKLTAVERNKQAGNTGLLHGPLLSQTEEMSTLE